MKADVKRRRVLAAAAVLLLAGCKPGAEGGYERIVSHPPPGAIGYEHPDPPPVTPGTSIGGPAAVQVTVADLPAGVTQEMVDEGQRLFGTICSACHGQNGVGTPAGPALNDGAWIQIGGAYEEIVAIIDAGVANPRDFPGIMPPRGGGTFDDAQVRAIGAYVYALSRQGGA